MEAEYVKFSKEWEKEMMKWRKIDLVEQLKKAFIKIIAMEKDLEHQTIKN